MLSARHSMACVSTPVRTPASPAVNKYCLADRYAPSSKGFIPDLVCKVGLAYTRIDYGDRSMRAWGSNLNVYTRSS